MTGRRWLLVFGALIVFGVVTSVAGDLVNVGGVTQWSRFWVAMFGPRLDAAFLRLAFDATLTTVAFAAVGTAMAVGIGIVGGVVLSETWWRKESGSRGMGRRVWRWWAWRSVFAFPRGVHEAIWGLVLVIVLGRDPLVGVLAIAIPFGAITAKVYAEIIDDAPHDAYESLRAGGTHRLVALVYGLLPLARDELVSYAFYRFECAIRSAVILGMIGAGGLGFELLLSFQSLNYDEMWTLIVATVLVSAVADFWSSHLRHRPGRSVHRLTVFASISLIAVSMIHLGIGVSRLFEGRTHDLFRRLAVESWPPSLPAGGWLSLGGATFDTLQMSVLGMALASVSGVVLAFAAARGGGTIRRFTAPATRALLLLLRSIPPPVWALVTLFLLFPGPLPGAVALGVYNIGILGRLMAESIENLDPHPRRALDAVGGGRGASFAYATLPQATPRLVSLSMYRWEVAIRETVIVGLVGAGGLGRLLAEQNAAFDFSGILGTVLAYVALSLAVDVTSAAVRQSIR